MENVKQVINELLVEVFNQILSIEQETLSKRGVKISMNEVHILEAIRNCEAPSMKTIAKKLRVTQGTLTTSVTCLVDKQYLVRYKDKKDRRKVFLKLKPIATKVLRIHDEFHNQMIDSIFKDLHIEENETLVKSLSNISEFFKEKYKEDV